MEFDGCAPWGCFAESIDPVPWHDLHAGSGSQWFIGYLPSSSWMALLISVMASCRSWVVVFLLSFRCPGCSSLMIAFWIAGHVTFHALSMS